jgi:hypothetical protein
MFVSANGFCREARLSELETRKKKTECPSALGNRAGLVISTSALPPEEGKKGPWGPLLVDRAPYFFRDSRQLLELGQERMGRWSREWADGQMLAGLIWQMICSMRQPLEAGA